MKSNLLGFLFGESQVREEIDAQLEDELTRLFEAADDADLQTRKTPLVDALKAIDVSGDVEDDPEGFCLRFDDGDDYRQTLAKLGEPDNFHKLAELGWVVAKCGDEAMANEPACFKVRFLEISTAEAGKSDNVPNLEKIRKDSQKDASTQQDRKSDDLNPVEVKNYGSDDNQKGVGDAKDGTGPEGTPKGSTKSESAEHILAKYLDGDPNTPMLLKADKPGQNLYVPEGGHKPGCQCGFCKNKGKGFGKKDKTDHTAPEGGSERDTTGVGEQESGGMPESEAHDIVNNLLETCGRPKCRKNPRTKSVAASPGKVTHESKELPEPPRVDEMTSVGAIPPLEAPMALNGGPRKRPNAAERLRRLKMRRDPEGIEGK